MIVATPENESKRLKALKDLEILDTDHEPEFDELVCLASAICEVPISLVSLIDADRQWFKAQIGLDGTETPRAWAFCDYAIRQDDVFVVEDASEDSRFADNPLVTDGIRIRFYAGMPVTAPDGHAVGTLCVIDSEPRSLTTGQKAALRILASQVSARFELREERKKLEKALKAAEEAHAKLTASEERFRKFMAHSPIVTNIKDSESRFVYYNQLFANRFGITETEWLGKSPFDLWAEDEARAIREVDLQVLSGQTVHAVQQSVHDREGKLSHWKSYRFPIHSSDGQVLIGTAGIEVTQERNREQELRKFQIELECANMKLEGLVRTDALTGLHNRRGFDERLEAEFSRARRTNRALSVMLLDVDNFKKLNDTYGHPEGDEVLRQLAKVLHQTARLGDLVARYGGEEFVVLLPEADEAQAMKIAHRFLRAIRGHGWKHCPVTVSIGVSSLSPTMLNVERLVSLADEALYAAKRDGKDCAIAYAEYLKTVIAEMQSVQPPPTSLTQPPTATLSLEG